MYDPFEKRGLPGLLVFSKGEQLQKAMSATSPKYYNAAKESEMAIGILHLSDIHLTGANDSATTRAGQIRLAVQGVCHDVSDVLLVTTGDVGFSGKRREYEVAQTFFERVVGDLTALPRVNFIGTVLIPGNHDCDFEKEGDDRQVLLSSIGTRIDNVDLAGSSVEQILKVQDAFFLFEESLCGIIASRNRLFWSREFDSGAGRISIRCLNTAWMSRKKELPAQLYFPIHAQGDLSKRGRPSVSHLCTTHMAGSNP